MTRYEKGFFTKCAEHGLGYDKAVSLLKSAQVSADGKTFTLAPGQTLSHVVSSWNKANPAKRITANQIIRANNGLKATRYWAGKAYKMPTMAPAAVAKPVTPAAKPAVTAARPTVAPKPAAKPVPTSYSGILTPEFYKALGEQESNNNDSAINTRENAHGRYQIRPGYLADANQRLGTNYTLQDMHDHQKAQQVMGAYFRRYAPGYTKRTGNPVTAEVLARIHNGGPRGAERDATAGYWNSVSNRLEAAKQK